RIGRFRLSFRRSDAGAGSRKFGTCRNRLDEFVDPLLHARVVGHDATLPGSLRVCRAHVRVQRLDIAPERAPRLLLCRWQLAESVVSRASECGVTEPGCELSR